MFCSNCGNLLPEGSKFCNRCGRSLAVSESDPEILPQRKKERKFPWAAVVVSLVLVAAIAAGLWFFVLGAKETVSLLTREETVVDSDGTLSATVVE